MNSSVIFTGLLLPILSLGWSTTLFGQVAQSAVIDTSRSETAVVEASCQVLKEIMEIVFATFPALQGQSEEEALMGYAKMSELHFYNPCEVIAHIQGSIKAAGGIEEYNRKVHSEMERRYNYQN